MANTAHLNLPKPDPAHDVDEEFIQLQSTLDLLDLIIWTLQGVVAGKATNGHEHVIDDIQGLVTALAAKMNADKTFSLDDLDDVSGAAGAAANYILVKNALGQWVPSSAIAALGIHEHAIGEILGLSSALSSITTALAATATKTGVETLTNKTLTAPTINNPTLILKQSSSPSQTAEGAVEWDTDDDAIIVGTGAARKIFRSNAWETIDDAVIASSSSWLKTDLSAFIRLRIDVDIVPTTAAGAVYMQFSADNGATWLAAPNYFTQTVQASAAAAGGFSSNGGDYVELGAGQSLRVGPLSGGFKSFISVESFNKARWTGGLSNWGLQRSGDNVVLVGSLFYGCTSTLAMNAVRIISGTAFTGTILLEGVRG